MKYFLVADIGGTNSSFSLLKIKNKKSLIIFKKNYLTSTYDNFSDIVNNFLNECVEKYNVFVENAVFAVAGKIEKTKVKLSLSNLVIDKSILIKKTSLKNIDLINDITAISYAIKSLDKKYLKILNKGNPNRNKPIIIIGVGTGLGKSLLIHNDISNNYLPYESEIGHSNISINSKLEFDLSIFISNKIKQNTKNNNELNITWGDILSGRGLEYIYEFLSTKKLSAKQISKNKKYDKFAKQTFEIFYRFFARFSKQNFLDNLCEGGIYLTGGIIQKNIIFSKKDFMNEFTNNKLFKSILKNVPINIIKNYDVSIFGLEKYVLLKEENTTKNKNE